MRQAMPLLSAKTIAVTGAAMPDRLPTYNDWAAFTMRGRHGYSYRLLMPRPFQECLFGAGGKMRAFVLLGAEMPPDGRPQLAAQCSELAKKMGSGRKLASSF